MSTVSCRRIVKVDRIITIVIGYTPSAAGVAVKEILVGAGETKSPTRLNAVATDSLRDWICCHYVFKEYQATHSWMRISIYVQTISNKIQLQQKWTLSANREIILKGDIFPDLSPPQNWVIGSISPKQGVSQAESDSISYAAT